MVDFCITLLLLIILLKIFDYSIQVLFDVCESQYLNTILKLQ